MEYLGDPYAHEDLTLGASATALTAATYRTTTEKPKNALITVETADIHYSLVSSVTPTATVGHLHKAGTNNPILLRGEQSVKQFRAFGNTAVLHVTYFR